MFCSYCGMKNYDNAAFCYYCGSPLTEIQQKKNKALPMILISCSIVVIITVILIIWVSSGSRQSNTVASHGFSTPEDAALNWLEGVYNNNYDLVAKTIYPDMIHVNVQRDIYKFQPSYIQKFTYSIQKTKIEDVSVDDAEIFEEAIRLYYNQDYNIREFKQIVVTVGISSDVKDYETSKEKIIVIKIANRWYSLMDTRIIEYYLQHSGFTYYYE